MQSVEARERPCTSVETSEYGLPFFRRESNACDLLRRLQHLQRNVCRILRHSQQSARHQRKSTRRKTFQKASSVEGELLLIHVNFLVTLTCPLHSSNRGEFA